MTVLAAFTQVVPLQYLVVLPITLFLIVTGIAAQRESKPERERVYRL